MVAKFSNTERIDEVNVPFIILHGRDDWIVPLMHSQKLSDTYQGMLTKDNAQVVQSESVHGGLTKVKRNLDGEFQGLQTLAWFAQLEYAGHNNVHCFDRAWDLIGEFFRASGEVQIPFTI